MTIRDRVAAHRERQKAEGIKTVSITMTTETHQILKDTRKSTNKTYQQIIEEALRSPLISADHMKFLEARAGQTGETIQSVLGGIIQAEWDNLKDYCEDPLESEPWDF